MDGVKFRAKHFYDRPVRFMALAGERKVGRHSLLFRIGSCKVLIDPGMNYFGSGNGQVIGHKALNGLTCVFLTHAHIDHIGALLEVTKTYPWVRIYATPATKALAFSVLKMRRSHSENGVQEAVDRIITAEYGQDINIGGNVYARFMPAGHVLGSAAILFTSPEGNYLFTGDFTTEDRGIFQPFQPPPVEVRAMVSEGSFVGLRAPSAWREKERFMAKVKSDMGKGKKVIVAANSLSVFQEYALILPGLQRRGEMPAFPIFFNTGLEPSFNVFFDFYHTLRIAEAGPADPKENYSVYKPLNSGPDPNLLPPFCYFASAASLRGDFPNGFARKVLRAGGTLIVDAKYPESLLRRRLGKPELLAEQFASFGTNNHIREEDLTSLFQEMRPQMMVLVHGMASKLIRYARRFGDQAEVPRLEKEIDLNPTFPRMVLPG